MSDSSRQTSGRPLARGSGSRQRLEAAARAHLSMQPGVRGPACLFSDCETCAPLASGSWHPQPSSSRTKSHHARPGVDALIIATSAVPEIVWWSIPVMMVKKLLKQEGARWVARCVCVGGGQRALRQRGSGGYAPRELWDSVTRASCRRQRQGGCASVM